MRKVILAIVCTLFLAASIQAADKPGTAKEAQQMVQKAVAYIKDNGKEKAFAEINDRNGQFVKGDLYIAIYDMKGICIAHGFNRALIGKDLSEMKDSDGKPFVKERIEMAKTKSSFWLDYKYTNPTTKKIEPKSMYSEVIDGMIVSCGIYKK